MLTHQVSGNENWYLKLLAYNFCAFAMQMPLGIVADKLTKYRKNIKSETVYLETAFIGCVLMLLLLMCRNASWLTVLIAGLGNALFHVGSGAEVLELYKGKTFAPGVFVSTGAVGLFAGKYLPFTFGMRMLLRGIFMATLGILGGMMRRYQAEASSTVRNAQLTSEMEKKAPSGNLPQRAAYVSIFFLFLVVVLRSLEGMILTFPWATGSLSAVLVCMTAGGKCAGGFAADRFGSYRTAVLSLGAASVLLFCSDFWLAAGLLGVLAFHMTMPITLTELFKRLPDYPGFAFGITTFALYLGLLPVYMELTGALSSPPVYGGMAVISLFLMAAALKRKDA